MQLLAIWDSSQWSTSGVCAMYLDVSILQLSNLETSSHESLANFQLTFRKLPNRVQQHTCDGCLQMLYHRV